jgi:multimeric flavodoxin WrbA
MTLTDRQAALCESNRTDFSGLSAVILNCTLKRSDLPSHTGLLLSVPAEIMRRNGVAVETIRPSDMGLAFGVQPDMTAQGWPQDAWPGIWAKVRAAEILILGTPIWLGEQSSVCRLVIERLYAQSGGLNERGQSLFYGKVGGAVVTGNEDGIKHCASSILYALNHLGCTIPPQADCGWIGEAGPGPSYGDDDGRGGSVGVGNDFTQRNTTIMTWNLLHMARMLQQAGGLPSHGNDRNAWKAGCRFDYENPEHRA